MQDDGLTRRRGSGSCRTGDKMKIDDRLNKMSKEQLIDMIKEVKLICDSNKSVESPIRNTLHFILKLIKGYHYEDKNV